MQAINDMYPAYACSVDTVANMKAELVQKQEAQMAGGAAHTRSSPAAASSGVAASAADTRRAFDAAIMTRHLRRAAGAAVRRAALQWLGSRYMLPSWSSASATAPSI